MFSQEAKKQISNCYMCWMCRHVCPIGYSTGHELHTPRGKGLLMNKCTHGEDVMKESAQAMYDCFLCNNCSSWCETGFQPTLFIREARTEIVARDIMPENVKKVVERTLDSTLYGEKKITGDLKKAVDALPDKAKVLLVLGDAVVMNQPEIGLAAISLMKKAGVDFTVMKDEPTAGADLYDLVGALADVQEVAKKFAAAVKATGAETVVALDPFTARILIADYPTWGAELPTVVTATAFFAEKLEKGDLKVSKKLGKAVTYHDSERLARDLEETENPRTIVSAMAGAWKEIFLNRENARCCGNDVVDAYSPAIVAKTSRVRMDDAMRTGAELIVTASASDKRILSKVEGDKIDVEDIFVLLDSCC